MKYLSFFSGALGLDLGLEMEGFEPLLYCEQDKSCQKTIKRNRPNITLLDNILNYSSNEINKIIHNKKVDLIVGGPPCQSFSTAGKRKSFDDKRGNVFLHFLEIATGISPEYIVIENVRGLLSAKYKNSTAICYVVNFLEKNGYKVSFNLYNTANFGVPQIRERVIIIATKSKIKVPYLTPTHSNDPKFNLPPWLTLFDAIGHIKDNTIDIDFSEKRKYYLRFLKSGQNWKNLPLDMQKEALGKSFFLGGGKTGFLRKLDWNKPCPTLLTSPVMQATSLCHPDNNRPLNIKEYSLIQQFSKDYIFEGSIYSKYRQIGNAVPIRLSKAIAKCLNEHRNKIEPINFNNFPYSRYLCSSDIDFMNKK